MKFGIQFPLKIFKSARIARIITGIKYHPPQYHKHRPTMTFRITHLPTLNLSCRDPGSAAPQGTDQRCAPSPCFAALRHLPFRGGRLVVTPAVSVSDCTFAR